MQQKIEEIPKKLKEIVDYRQSGDHLIFYLVVWEDGTKQWVQDVNLVGCDRQIEQFFTGNGREQEQEYEQKEGEENDKMKTRQGFKKVQRKEGKIQKIAQWNVSGSRKRVRIEKGEKSKRPMRSKKYLDRETVLLANKIQQLKRYIESNRPPQTKLDYLCKDGPMQWTSLRAFL